MFFWFCAVVSVYPFRGGWQNKNFIYTRLPWKLPVMTSFESLKSCVRPLKRRARQLARLERKIAELEERLSLNSENSSKPPSTDQKKNRRNPQGGAVKGHKGSFRKLSDKVDKADHLKTWGVSVLRKQRSQEAILSVLWPGRPSRNWTCCDTHWVLQIPMP